LLIAAWIMPGKMIAELRDEAEELKRISGAIIVSANK
jgi:hypothetical protein